MCKKGLSIVSWIIVFIPFILMTYITAVLMFVFGLSPTDSNINYNVVNPNENSDVVIVKNPNKTVVVNNNDDNDEYDPDDFTSGTPKDINNYN